MALSDQVIISLHNASGVAIVRGQLVRAAIGPNQAALAQADSLANLAGVLGPANNATGIGGVFNCVASGRGPVLLETGLSPSVGQTVYVSASVAGRGTTAPPTFALAIGTIIDASAYSTDRTVIVDVEASVAVQATGTAGWDLSLVRYFLLDNESGSDNNVGYVDAAPGTDLSSVAATVAIKTIEKFMTIFPVIGNGRSAEVIMKARADGSAYLNSAGAVTENFNLTGFDYPMFAIRGTATVATGGAVAFANTTADRICVGGRVVSGTNSAGYKCTPKTLTVTNAVAGAPCAITFSASHGLSTGDYLYLEGIQGVTGANGRYAVTVTGAATVTLMGSNSDGTYIAGGTAYTYLVTKADGSPAGFTDDMSSTAITGLRARWDSSSAAPNTVVGVWANSANTILFDDVPSPTVTSADVFYLEEPGTQVTRLGFSMDSQFRNSSTSGSRPFTPQTYVVGMKVGNGMEVARGGVAFLTFVSTPDLRSNVGQTLFTTKTWAAPTTGTTVATAAAAGPVCVGDRNEVKSSALQLLDVQVVLLQDLYCVRRAGAFPCLIAGSPVVNVDRRCGFARGLQIRGCGLGGSVLSGGQVIRQQDSAVGAVGTGGTMPIRFFGAFYDLQNGLEIPAGLGVSTSNINLQSVVCEVTVANGVGVAVVGSGSRISIANVNGSSNTAYGIGMNTGFNGFSEANAHDNTLVIQNLFGVNGIRGITGAYQLGARDSQQITIQNLDFETQAIASLVDGNANHIFVDRRSGGYTTAQVCLQIEKTNGYLNNTGSTIPKFRIVRTTATFQEMAPALADTDGHARGTLGVTVDGTLTGAYGLVVPIGEENFVEFDRSGGLPAPAVGGTAYLSTATAGLAQASVPASAATNQKLIIGTITAIHPTNTDMAAVALNISPEPVLA